MNSELRWLTLPIIGTVAAGFGQHSIEDAVKSESVIVSQDQKGNVL